MTIKQMIAKHIATRQVVDGLAVSLAIGLINLYIDTDRLICYHQHQIGIIRRLLISSDDASIHDALHPSGQLGSQFVSKLQLQGARFY